MSKADLYLDYWKAKMPEIIAGIQANSPIDITDIIEKATNREFGVSFRIADQKFFGVYKDVEKDKAPKTYVRYFFDVFKETAYFKEHLINKTLHIKISHRAKNETIPIWLTVEIDINSEAPKFNHTSLEEYIELYKKLINDQLPELEYSEIYKWETIQHFQDNWTDDHDSDTILSVLKASFDKDNNNLWSGQNYLPYRMLLEFAGVDPARVSSMFKSLFNESLLLTSRFENFQAEAGAITDKIYPDQDFTHHQSDRALMLYLSLRYPDRYYLYKSRMFRIFCELTEFVVFPKGKKLGIGVKTQAYVEMCEKLRPILVADQELVKLHKQRLPPTITFNDNFHVLTQDFIYAVTTYLNKQIKVENENENEDENNSNVNKINQLGMALNQILYGPPGTGKTFNSINHAIAIIEGMPLEAVLTEPRVDIKKRFDNYLQAGQIVFTTFHQSMSYEDFIEGIKPETVEEEVTYEVKDGIFKALCTEAAFSIAQNIKSAGTVKALDFAALYDQFVDSLETTLSQQGAEVAIPTKSGGSVKVEGISPQGNIIVKHIDGSRSYTISKQRLTVLDQNIDNLDDVNNINSKFREIIGGSNSSAYWAVLKVIRSLKPLDTKAEKRTYTITDKLGAISSLQRGDYQKSLGVPYVIIIDEINRGNIAQIFGELITLIEEDKRLGHDEALEVTLPYSKEKFGVPPNVYIMGTMNTADRSVEALDTALRRRFSFIEILPNPKLIETHGKLKEKHGIVEGIDLVGLLSTINKRIEKLLDKDHLIGHSYFMDVSNLRDLKSAFQNKINPLLQEYFYGDFGKIGLVLGTLFFQESTLKNDQDNLLFAEFSEYEVSELLDRKVYRLLDVTQMSDDAFKTAISKMLRK